MNIVGFKFRAIHECPPSYLNAIWLAGDCPWASQRGDTSSTSALAATRGGKYEPSKEASEQAASVQDTGFSASHRHLRVWHKPSESKSRSVLKLQVTYISRLTHIHYPVE
jgi:hypothetical protein